METKLDFDLANAATCRMMIAACMKEFIENADFASYRRASIYRRKLAEIIRRK